MRFILSILITGVLFFSLPSCKKNSSCNGFVLQSFNDSLTTNTFTVTNGKPVKLAERSGAYTTYHYNSNSLIDTIANYDVTGLKISIQVYTYSGQQLASQTVYSSANDVSGVLTVVSQDQYTYTGSNITADNEIVYTVSDTDNYTISYAYDNNNNVTVEEKDQTYPPSQALRLVYKRYYTYDSNHNPWGILAKYMDYFSTNNILTLKDSLTPADNMSYYYQYNSNGYPVIITESATTGYVKTDQYNYCQ